MAVEWNVTLELQRTVGRESFVWIYWDTNNDLIIFGNDLGVYRYEKSVVQLFIMIIDWTTFES